MKLKQLYILLVLNTALCLNAAISQQINMGISVNPGLSKIANTSPPSDNQPKYAISGNYGAFAEIKMGKHSSLGLELLWIQIEGKDITKDKTLHVFDGQGPMVIGVISDESRLHSTYIGLPFYYRFSMGKLGLKAGVQTMLFLLANSSYEADGVLYGEPYHAESKAEDIKLNKIDYGPKIGIDYKIFKNFRLRMDYYHAITALKSDGVPFERKNRQATIGVQYIFGVKDKQ